MVTWVDHGVNQLDLIFRLQGGANIGNFQGNVKYSTHPNASSQSTLACLLGYKNKESMSHVDNNCI